jgi:phage FluMu protein Com
VECDLCNKQLAASSLSNHLETQHGVFRSRVINQDLLIEHESRTFTAHRNVSGTYACPVPGCVGTAHTNWTLRWHFHGRHPWDCVSIDGANPLPKCERCGLQCTYRALNTTHTTSQYCKEATERRVQQQAAVNSARALDVTFKAYGQSLERVEVFKYLGRLLAMDDNDMPAVRANLKKARKCWTMFSRLLTGENMSPRVCGMFYRAVIQSVLLFGSESWVLTDTAMRVLEGFHVRSAYRMAREHKPRKNNDTGVWRYPYRLRRSWQRRVC